MTISKKIANLRVFRIGSIEISILRSELRFLY